MIHFRPGFAPVYTPPDAPPEDKRRRPLGAAAMKAKAAASIVQPPAPVKQPVPDPKAAEASPSQPAQISQAERIAVLEQELALARQQNLPSAGESAS